jgi:type VI secretion system secreted protein VgrG
MPIYEYPARSAIGSYDQDTATYQQHNTRRLARVRLEEHRTRDHVGQGRSNVHAITPGYAVAVAGHERPTLDRRYLVTRVEHTGQAWHTLPAEILKSPRARQILADMGLPLGATGDDPTALQDRYVNRFFTHRLEGMETSAPFRPERVTPRPVIEGPQTARIVGPAGEDIHTDKHGRVKVQFHWDRVGREDENSSCWIRTAQNMGGAGWGFVFIPRIGMEVVVQFIEGDPDRPLVTSVVYNGENPTPYGLPEEKTKTSLKTWSTPKTGGYNEMRFEDAAGKEQVYVQAERDMDTLVKHDETLTVQRHRTKLVQGDEFNTVEMNRVSKVVQNDTLTVDGNREAEVHGPTGDTLTVDNDQEVKVGGSQSITVSGSQSTTVSKSQSTTVMMASQETVTLMKAVQVGLAFQITVGARFEVICGMSRLTMDALGNISLSGEQIDITSNGPVAVNGTIIDLN